MRAHCGYDESECGGDRNDRHEGYHHASSMNEIQQALKEGLTVLDSDGDVIKKATIKPKQSKKTADAMGSFKVRGYDGQNFSYMVTRVLVEDGPIDEEEIMKSLLVSLQREELR